MSPRTALNFSLCFSLCSSLARADCQFPIARCRRKRFTRIAVAAKAAARVSMVSIVSLFECVWVPPIKAKGRCLRHYKKMQSRSRAEHGLTPPRGVAAVRFYVLRTSNGSNSSSKEQKSSQSLSSSLKTIMSGTSGGGGRSEGGSPSRAHCEMSWCCSSLNL